MKLTKNKWIILISVILIIAVIVYFIFFKNKNLISKQTNITSPPINQTQPQVMVINNADDFINAVKYLGNPKPFGYNLLSLENKRDYINSIDINTLKQIYQLLQDISKNSDSDNSILIDFLQKLFS